MGKRKWTICDRLGWPVERIKGRPITNLIRLLIHGRKVRRWPPENPWWEQPSDVGTAQQGPGTLVTGGEDG